MLIDVGRCQIETVLLAQKTFEQLRTKCKRALRMKVPAQEIGIVDDSPPYRFGVVELSQKPVGTLTGDQGNLHEFRRSETALQIRSTLLEESGDGSQPLAQRSFMLGWGPSEEVVHALENLLQVDRRSTPEPPELLQDILARKLALQDTAIERIVRREVRQGLQVRRSPGPPFSAEREPVGAQIR
jgi:hypothetical protein